MAPGWENQDWGLGAKSFEKFLTTPLLPLENALFEHIEWPHIDKKIVEDQQQKKASNLTRELCLKARSKHDMSVVAAVPYCFASV